MYTVRSLLMSIPNSCPVENAHCKDVEGSSHMCSNCSGDDPRPESFASFDISSPKTERIFAAMMSEKRKRYRTPQFLSDFTKGALIAGAARVRRRHWYNAIIGNANRQRFVNLNLRGNSDDQATNTSVSGDPIEIRVLPNAIIEVYTVRRIANGSESDRGQHEDYSPSAWEESFAARSGARWTPIRYQGLRQLKYLAGYGTFLIVVALVVWCAIS
jgi:hypothetical protein